MEFLNEYSGLFSLLAVGASVIVPFWIYRKQKKEQEKYYFMQKNDQEHFYNLQKKDQEHFYQKQQNDHLQDLREEYDAMDENSQFPMTFEERGFYGRKNYLEKKLRRK